MMHAQRDIVLSILPVYSSVRPSIADTISKEWTYRHVFDGLTGATLSTTAVTKLLGEPSQRGVECIGVGKFCK